MTRDPRTTLAQPALADARLQGVIAAQDYAPTRAMRCRAPAAGIHAEPSQVSEQPDQLLFGEGFDVLQRVDGWSYGQARRDGYVGFVRDWALAEGTRAPTHRVRALRAYGYDRPDIKAPPRGLYSMNALVRIEGGQGRFLEDAEAGWFAADQLAPIGEVESDPAAVAEQFLGAPYQWGGRESLGLDCSGLVMAALQACGRACPRDTDMQWAALGRPGDDGPAARGDLVFWEGHVGFMLDGERLLHASGDWAAVVIEPFTEAAARIAAAGRGAPLGRRRL